MAALGIVSSEEKTRGQIFIIRKILEHLKLWEEPDPRPPPAIPEQVGAQ
jgi:hypothetical protein